MKIFLISSQVKIIHAELKEAKRLNMGPMIILCK